MMVRSSSGSSGADPQCNMRSDAPTSPRLPISVTTLRFAPLQAPHSNAPKWQASSPHTHLQVVLVGDAIGLVGEGATLELVRPVVGQAQRMHVRQRGAPPAGLKVRVWLSGSAWAGARGC